MSTRGNILLVANWESDVGYAWWLMEGFWVRISSEFSTTGDGSLLIYPRITRLPESIEQAQIRTLEFDFRTRSLGQLMQLLRMIRSNGIRHIYLSDASTYSMRYLALRFAGVRNIIVHDHSPGERTPASGLNRLIKSCIQRIPLITADHFIAVTDYVYDRFTGVNCIPEKKCSVAHNGITPIDTSSADDDYVYRTFDIPKDRTVIVTTGRASTYKGIDFFIEVANTLIMQQGHDELHFLFCGDGPDIDQFRELVERYRLGEHFTFAGKRSDIRELLPSCNIGLHCSKGEVGYSLSILEYMSAGLATIVADRPSTREATRDGETGYLYEPEDLGSACEAVLKCLDEDNRGRVGDAARREVLEQYDIRRTHDLLADAINDATR